jgi:hypothetical protein
MPNSKRGTESYAAPEVTVGSLSKLFYRNAGIEHCDQGDINPVGVLYDAPFDLQLKIFRGGGTETAVAATLAAVRADVEAGVFWRVRTWVESIAFSSKHGIQNQKEKASHGRPRCSRSELKDIPPKTGFK